VSTRERILLATTIVGAFIAGGVAGAGVHLQWYSAAVGVSAAALLGLATGGVLLRTAIRARRARRSSSGQ
jgi:hypothetical protein